MSDELLRHLATSSGEYAGMRALDPKTNKYETVFTGQSMRLLMSMCNHANVDRICFVGRETFMEETGLNGETIDNMKRRLLSAGILNYLGTTSYKGSRPVSNYLIDFPNLPPLEDVLTEKEIKKKARSLSASKTVLAIDSADASTGVLLSSSHTALDPALPVRHKQKQLTEKEYEPQQEQEWSHGCHESEPSEDEVMEFLDLREALEDPF
jgi:hypothetical protein